MVGFGLRLICAWLRVEGCHQSSRYTAKEVDAIMKEVDLNGDGFLGSNHGDHEKT